MRDSMGGAWLFGLIITFMLIIVGYLTLMLNYSTVFKVKNEVVHIIEKYEGMSDTTLTLINNYLKNSGYMGTGTCPDDMVGVTDLTDTNVSNKGASNAYYCFNVSLENGTDSGYYSIRLFLNIDLPVLGQLGQFKVNGETIKIKYIQYENAYLGV